MKSVPDFPISSGPGVPTDLSSVSGGGNLGWWVVVVFRGNRGNFLPYFMPNHGRVREK